MKYTMTKAAAKRIAANLIADDRSHMHISWDKWRRALDAEGFRGYTATNMIDVINILRSEENADDREILNLTVSTLIALALEVGDHRGQWNALSGALGHMNQFAEVFKPADEDND